jgi:transposase
MARLSEVDRNQAIGMFVAGSSKSAIARRFGCHHSTISRLVARYQQTGTVRDRVRPGRARVTTLRQDRYLLVTHLRDRFLPAATSARRTVGTHG